MPTQMLPMTDGPYGGPGGSNHGDPSADVERFFAHQRAIQGIGPAQLDESSTMLRNKGTPASSQPMLPVQGGYTMPVPPTGLSGTQNLGAEAWRAQVLGPQNEPSFAPPGQDPSQGQPYPTGQSSQSGPPPPFAGRDPSVPPADPRSNAEHQRMLSEQSTIVTRGKRSGGGGKAILIGGLSALILGLGVGATLYFLKKKDTGETPSASASANKDSSATATTSPAAVVTSAPTTPPTMTPPSDPTASVSTGSPPTSTAPTADPPQTSNPPATSSPPVATSPPVTPPVAAGDPDSEAKEALKKLQIGLAACVKSVTHVLPPTSPSVPGGLSVLKRGPYEPTPRDWLPSFYTCTQFKIEQPMRFMIQWQLEQPNWRGSAIAWIDADGDGSAEKAYAFWAELKGADNVEVGPIESVDPERRFRIPR